MSRLLRDPDAALRGPARRLPYPYVLSARRADPRALPAGRSLRRKGFYE